MSTTDKVAACQNSAAAVLQAWIEAVTNQKLEETLALYADDAILVPTLTNGPLNTPDERRAYFVDFLAKVPKKCTITYQDVRTNKECDTVVTGGLYTFEMATGPDREVPARFLFVFEEIDGRWLITGHHSSKEIAEKQHVTLR